MLFISSIDALSKLVASNSKESILIGGELILLSHDKASAFDIGSLTDRYVAQPPRMASRRSLFSKGSKSLYVSVDKQAVEMILAHKGQVALSADQYLAYGLSQKKNVIVMGGGEAAANGNVNIEGFVFTDQGLVDSFERHIALNGYMLDMVLKDVLTKYPDHYVHWCDPLGPIPECDLKNSDRFIEAGDAALKSIIKRKVFSRKQSEEEGWGLLPAMGISIVGFLVFAASTGYQWKQLEAERLEYQQEIAGYEEAYQNSSHSLELLRHRDFLMSAPSESASKVAMLDNLIVKVASIDGVLIHNIKVIDEDDNSSGSDRDDFFVLDISVPKESSMSGARKQAEKLVKQINSQLGMTVRVISHTPFTHPYGGSSKEYWRYTLGGSQ